MQLIKMYQKIRTIESIKKITHAMRLISMSNHTQLNHKVPFIENYKNELYKIIKIIEPQNLNSKNNFFNLNEKSTKKLIILIGSQKGLTGTFNTSLFKFVEQKIHDNFKDFDFITVGKKATDFIKKYTQPIYNYDNFSTLNLQNITNNIFALLKDISQYYASIIIYSNYPRSFFSQTPQENIILPIQLIKEENNLPEVSLDNYIWEQPVDEIYQNLMKQYIHFSIQSLLFNSLLAEQASRFQSMDKATTNAEELLDNLKIQYNKMRQTKITKEITELSASLR